MDKSAIQKKTSGYYRKPEGEPIISDIKNKNSWAQNEHPAIT